MAEAFVTESSRLAGIIQRSTSNLFASMLGCELVMLDSFTENDATRPSDGVVAVMAMAGAYVGIGAVACSAEAACRLAGMLMGEECRRVSREVLDAMGEIANMIVGGIKSELEETLGPVSVSVPTVICGREFYAHTTLRRDWTVVVFQTGEHRLTVRMCLGQGRPSGVPLPAGALTVL